MGKKVKIPALPHDLRLAKIDGFGRTGKYYALEENSNNSAFWLAMLTRIMFAFR